MLCVCYAIVLACYNFITANIKDYSQKFKHKTNIGDYDMR